MKICFISFFTFFHHPNHYLVTCCELAAGFVPRVVEDALVYCRHEGLTLIERQVCASHLSATVQMEHFLLRRCGSLDRSTANEGVGRGCTITNLSHESFSSSSANSLSADLTFLRIATSSSDMSGFSLSSDMLGLDPGCGLGW